ncbi:MAG: M3 family oligoendopeptidase [Chloroflexi bacterium]|nr:M3 family oligoendopeptidase [Chloroflexota bacterium]
MKRTTPQKSMKAEVEAAAQRSSAAGVAWDLSVLFDAPDDARLEASLKALKKRTANFARTWRGKVKAKPKAAQLLEALREYESMAEELTKVGAYAHLLYAADTRQDAHRNLMQHVDEVETALRNEQLFFDLEWLEVSEEMVKTLLADPKLAPYKHYLQSERKYKPHALSEPEEKIMNEKSMTGLSAWQKLFTELTSSLRYKIEVDGVVRELNQSEVLVLLRHPDRAQRRCAWEGFYATLKENGQTLGFIYDTRFQDYLVNNRLRKYKTHMQPRHLSNGIEAKAVDAMMTVVERNHGLAHRYWALKAKLLGLQKLELYDQYAPLFDVKEKISYTDGKQIVLDALRRFSPEFETMAQRFFDGNWIDADPRDGKRGGAFCAGVTPSTHPFILMSYNDDLRDVTTLAHELGHGMHDLLAAKQTLFNYHPSLPVAETASVFAESLVFEELLGRMSNERDRLALLCGKIEDSFATVYRQTVLTRFEQLAYDARSKGRLGAQQIGELWLRANAPYYGDVVDMTSGYEFGWSYIPHFINTPFYCYAYSFGELLVKALYGMYRRDGAKFIPKYKALLASGGSRTPREQTRAIGVDINSEAFWQIGFDELERLIAEAEQLAGRL